MEDADHGRIDFRQAGWWVAAACFCSACLQRAVCRKPIDEF